MNFRAFLILGLMAFPAWANDIQPASMESLVSGRNGLVDLICPLADSTDRFVSQAFAVDIPEARDFEVLVATRHGVGGLLPFYLRKSAGK